MLPDIEPIFGHIKIEIWQVNNYKPLYDLKIENIYLLEKRKSTRVRHYSAKTSSSNATTTWINTKYDEEKSTWKILKNW